MRALAIGTVVLLAATSGAAQVQLTVGRDGTKVISNFGGVLGAHGSDWNWLARQRNRSSKYDHIIERWSAYFGVDPVLVRAVIQVESDFNPNCVSNKGARGLMQLMPATARQYGVKQVHDPEENIRAGVQHLLEMLNRFPGDLPRALAAYNAGPGAVMKYGGIPPYRETMTYVKRALTVYYGQPYGQATTIAGRRGGPKLKGGFTSQVSSAVATLPGMKYLGSIGR